MDPTEKEDSGRFLSNISDLVFFRLVERIEDKGPSHLPFFHFIPIEREDPDPSKIFSFQRLKEWKGKVPLLKTTHPVSGMGEEWPEISLALKSFRFL